MTAKFVNKEDLTLCPFFWEVLGRGKKRDRNIVDVVERYWYS
jgi:hypothetical protein